MGDEELAAVGSRAGIGHAEDTGAGMQELRMKLIDETIARATAAIALRIAALNHKIRNAAVEGKRIVIGSAGRLGSIGNFPFCETYEIGNSKGCLFILQ